MVHEAMVDRRSAALAIAVLLLAFHQTFGQPLQSTSWPDDHAALLRLRSSLGLRARDWPRKADHCTGWKGIRCRDFRVVGIDISGFRRTRIGSRNPKFSVEALANLSSLVSFNSSRFLLPGPIPDWFGQRLAALQVLDLSSCLVTGPIPSSLGALTNLTTLSLSNNSLAGIIPPGLGRLSRLSFLDLSDNSLSGSIPPAFGTLYNLRLLNISTNNLSSSVPSQLGDLARLVDIDLSRNSFSGSLPADFRGLRSLQKMAVASNSLGGPLPRNLFSSLNSLQCIVLSENNFSGSLPDGLFSIPKLFLLDLAGNNFTGNLPSVSLSSNITASVLNISGNKFYGGLTSVHRRFSSFDLSKNYFEGRAPDFATRNASLLSENCLQNVSNQRSLLECRSFYAERNLTFDDFGQLPYRRAPNVPQSSGKDRKWIILVAILGGVGLLLLLLGFLALLFLCCCRKSVTSQRRNGIGPVSSRSDLPPPGASIDFSILGEAFTYQQLFQATDDFSDMNLIKHGHSGDIFRGLLEGGVPVVIKRINLQSVKKEGYQSELEIFSRASHPRLVPLVGHCSGDENQKFLLYKYMPNGDLANSLFRKMDLEDDSLQSLDWITRLKIAIGAAEGLSYLHHECNPPLVHRDVQASSILLDDKFEVRLGSLSSVSSQDGDTHQNVISRFLRLPQTSEPSTAGLQTMTCAHDVYSFGKVLLELVTGQLGISSAPDSRGKEWMDQMLPYISIHDKELVTKIVDPSLIIDEDLLEEVWAMAIVARSCLNPRPSRRPLMRYIVRALENPLKVVREESSSSGQLRAASSRGSWNAALFGSWRQSMSEAAAAVPTTSTARGEAGSSLKQSGTTGSQGSIQNGGGGGGSSSQRRHSREVAPEPSTVGED